MTRHDYIGEDHSYWWYRVAQTVNIGGHKKYRLSNGDKIPPTAIQILAHIISWLNAKNSGEMKYERGMASTVEYSQDTHYWTMAILNALYHIKAS